MGKKSKSKNAVKKQKAKHIISGLYKIKTINRKRLYTKEELQCIIFESEKGLDVINELYTLGVTGAWLKKQGKEFEIAYILLGCELQ